MQRTICYLENGTSGGGSFESVLQLVQHLDRDRFAPVVVCANAVPILDRFRALGVRTTVIADPVYSAATQPWVRAGAARALAATRRVAPPAVPFMDAFVHRTAAHALRRILHAERVALLHCNNQPLRDAYGIAVARACGIPVICHLRSVRVGAMAAPVARWVGRSVTRAIANSHFTRTWWSSYGGIVADRIAVIPNPVGCPPVDPVDVRAQWNIPRDASVIGCVANFAAGKGHRFLLDAFALVRRAGIRATLLLVGDGPLRASLAAYAAMRGCSDHVRTVGYDDRARAIIAGCDVLVVPSETETFGRVIVEAFSVGTPVVATRVGGIPELIRDGEHGILVPFDDAVACAAAVTRILRTPTLADALRAAGRSAIAVGTFDPAAHARAVERVYDGVVR